MIHTCKSNCKYSRYDSDFNMIDVVNREDIFIFDISN